MGEEDPEPTCKGPYKSSGMDINITDKGKEDRSDMLTEEREYYRWKNE